MQVKEPETNDDGEVESLNMVSEEIRDDGKFMLFLDGFGNDVFSLEINDGEMKLTFDRVEANIKKGEQWAALYNGGEKVAFLSNRSFINIPTWVFEELGNIAIEQEFRPTEDYEKRYVSVNDRGQEL
jgi:hypothetical protein